MVTFVIEGTTSDVNTTAYAVCDNISNSTSYSFNGYDLTLSSFNIVSLFISGSILVTFVIEGTTSDVNTTAYAVCDSISNSTSYSFNGYDLTLSSFMTVNNQTYYGVTCGEIVSFNVTEFLISKFGTILLLLYS